LFNPTNKQHEFSKIFLISSLTKTNQMLVSPFKLSQEGSIGLTIGRLYEVLGIEADYFRIITDPEQSFCPNDPVLYGPEIFEIIDPFEPSFWVSETGGCGERYAYPDSWKQTGFFEDYHDGEEDVRKKFWQDIQLFYPFTWGKVFHDTWIII
jgi:hypothetical protein